jgi:hypothetical protein
LPLDLIIPVPGFRQVDVTNDALDLLIDAYWIVKMLIGFIALKFLESPKQLRQRM